MIHSCLCYSMKGNKLHFMDVLCASAAASSQVRERTSPERGRRAHWTESLMTSKFCHGASAKTSPPPLIALPPSISITRSLLSCPTASPLVHPSVSRICNTSQVSSTAPCFAMRLSRRRPPASYVRISPSRQVKLR